jgi:tellurite resistance protein
LAADKSMSNEKTFLAACMAAAAIIARVDGWVSAEERELVKRLHLGMGPLQDFDSKSVLAQFDHFVRLLKTPRGIEVAWAALDAVASDGKEAQMIMAFSQAIAKADRVVDAEEALLLRMIGVHLGLSQDAPDAV